MQSLVMAVEKTSHWAFRFTSLHRGVGFTGVLKCVYWDGVVGIGL